MAVNSKQLVYLNEMGIALWQRKNNPSIADTKLCAPSTATNIEEQQPAHELKNETAIDVIEVSLSTLNQSQLFRDILTLLGCTTADISEHHQYLDCGLFNWQFSSNQEISYKNNQLFTPTIEKISGDSECKKRLFATIFEHNLMQNNQ